MRRIIAIEPDLEGFPGRADGDNRTGTVVLGTNPTSNEAFAESSVDLVVFDVGTVFAVRLVCRREARGPDGVVSKGKL